MEQNDRAKNYHQGNKRIFYLSLGLDVVFLFALQLSGVSVRFRELAFSASGPTGIAHGIYVLLFCLSFYVLQFPLNFFSGYVWEHRFRLSRQTFPAWLKDEIKKGLLGFALTLVLVEIVYFLLGKFPAGWWIGAAIFWLFLSLFLARIMPNLIIPLFYKYTKIENEELRQRIFALFEKCGVKIQDIYGINLSAKTKKANAFVCGLGKSRRVVLSDTLLADFTIPEIETVVAHELGHYKHQDIFKMTLVNALLIFGAFFLIDRALGASLRGLGLVPSDIAGLPFFVLGMVIFGFVTTPFLNGFSRWLETEADKFSLKVTGRREDFISMMNKLGALNLAEFSPSRFDEVMFYDHPPIAKRIDLAKKFLEQRETAAK